MTCIGFQVFRGDHDHKTDRSFITKHFVGPAANRAHTFDCSYTVVSNQHLQEKHKPLVPYERHACCKGHHASKNRNNTKKKTQDFRSYFFDDAVATKSGNKLRRRSHGEVPLNIHLPVVMSFFHQVKTRHTRPTAESSWLVVSSITQQSKMTLVYSALDKS